MRLLINQNIPYKLPCYAERSNTTRKLQWSPHNYPICNAQRAIPRPAQHASQMVRRRYISIAKFPHISTVSSKFEIFPDKKSTFMSTFGKEVKRINAISLFCAVIVLIIALLTIKPTWNMVYTLYITGGLNPPKMRYIFYIHLGNLLNISRNVFLFVSCHFRHINYVLLILCIYTPIANWTTNLRLLQQMLCFHSSCSHIALKFRKIAASLADLNLVAHKTIPRIQPKKCKWRRSFLNILQAHNEAMAAVPQMMGIFSVSIILSLTYAAFHLSRNVLFCYYMYRVSLWQRQNVLFPGKYFWSVAH